MGEVADTPGRVVKIKLGISQTSLDELDFEKIEFSKIKAIRFLDKYLKQQS